jgi:hypothetical protein
MGCAVDESNQVSSVETSASPSPGWYPDPTAPNQQRYWDGAAWSEQIAPLPPPPAPLAVAPASSQTQNWGHATAVLASLGIVVGSLGPWATTALESISGTHTDGKYLVVAGLVALALSIRRSALVLAMVIGILAVIDGIVVIGHINDYSVSAFGQEVHPASVGWGLWLTVISGAALAVGGSRLRSEARETKHGQDEGSAAPMAPSR